mmetsp:Transcript_7064/g.26767  ORF Transcript_7064/g.26767 Transcript_7064/m.26767 type:complete len:267 (+) Transcript_7064:1266-2066(+)
MSLSLCTATSRAASCSTETTPAATSFPANELICFFKSFFFLALSTSSALPFRFIFSPLAPLPSFLLASPSASPPEGEHAHPVDPPGDPPPVGVPGGLSPNKSLPGKSVSVNARNEAGAWFFISGPYAFRYAVTAASCVRKRNSACAVIKGTSVFVPPTASGISPRGTPKFPWKCDDALPFKITNLCRALSVRKNLAMPHTNWNTLGACATTNALKGSGWNIAAMSCPAMAVMFALVYCIMLSFPKSIMKIEGCPDRAWLGCVMQNS